MNEAKLSVNEMLIDCMGMGVHLDNDILLFFPSVRE